MSLQRVLIPILGLAFILGNIQAKVTADLTQTPSKTDNVSLTHFTHAHSSEDATNSRNLSDIDPDVIYASQTVLGLHKWVLFFGWGLVVDLSIFVARYCKTWKHYLGVHALLFFLLDVSTVVFVILMLTGNSTKLSHVSEMTSKTVAHYIIGLIILALDVIVHILGFNLKHGIEGNNPNIPKIKKAHKVLGILLYVICKTNLVIGSSIQDDLPGGLVIMILSIVLMIIAETYHRYRTKQDN